jgi:hypothetical protein
MTMDDFLALINAAACGFISVALLGAILSHRVRDGVVIKVGLISMAMGFGSISLRLLNGIGPDELLGLERGLLLVNAGVAVVIFGYLHRKAEGALWERRSDHGFARYPWAGPERRK